MRRWRRGPNVTVGIQGAAAAEDRGAGETNASLAAIHEFGAPAAGIPSRPFMRGTVEREQSLIARMLDRAARRGAMPQGNLLRELGVVGERVRAEMIRTIDNTIGLAELKQATIDAKGGKSRPLIDSGTLKNSITHVVHRR